VGLASVELQTGHAARALELAVEAGRQARADGDEATQAAALAVEGAAAEQTGDLARARRCTSAALAIDRQREVPYEVREHLRALARLAEASGDLSQAAILLTRSARISRWLRQLDAATGELDQAQSLAERAKSESAQDAVRLERRLLEEVRQNSLPPEPAFPDPTEAP
jgi:tetratricopeptide (TPR) repeat protein